MKPKTLACGLIANYTHTCWWLNGQNTLQLLVGGEKRKKVHTHSDFWTPGNDTLPKNSRFQFRDTYPCFT